MENDNNDGTQPMGFFPLFGICLFAFFALIIFVAIVYGDDDSIWSHVKNDGAPLSVVHQQHQQQWLTLQYMEMYIPKGRPKCARFNIAAKSETNAERWFVNYIFKDTRLSGIFYVDADPNTGKSTLYAYNGTAQQNSKKFESYVERVPYEFRSDPHFPSVGAVMALSKRLFPVEEIFDEG